MDFKRGDMFIQDAGDGDFFIKVVSDVDASGRPSGFSIQVNGSGAFQGMSMHWLGSFVDEWPTRRMVLGNVISQSELERDSRT